MVYKELSGTPEELANIIQNQTRADLKEFMQLLAKEIISDANGDLHAVYDYFSPVYDKLYHALVFNRIDIQKETKELLETLATPLFKKDLEEQKKIIDTYIP